VQGETVQVVRQQSLAEACSTHHCHLYGCSSHSGTDTYHYTYSYIPCLTFTCYTVFLLALSSLSLSAFTFSHSLSSYQRDAAVVLASRMQVYPQLQAVIAEADAVHPFPSVSVNV
jgi:hypothetical protein